MNEPNGGSQGGGEVEGAELAKMVCALCFDYNLLEYQPHDPILALIQPRIPAITHARMIRDGSIELTINRTSYILEQDYTLFNSDFIGGFVELTSSGRTLLAFQTEHSCDDSEEEWDRVKSVDEFVGGPWVADFQRVYRQARKSNQQGIGEPGERHEWDVNIVAEALCNHLKAEGYQILRQRPTMDKGINVMTEHPSQIGRLLIDVKGGNVARKCDRRFAKAANRYQVLARVAKGFYNAARLYSVEPKTSDRVALAYPDTAWFRYYLKPIKALLDGLGITVFLVREDHSVATF